MDERLLHFAHDLARHAVLASEQLSGMEAEMAPDQVAKLRGVLGLEASCAELLVGRRPLPMLLEVLPQGEQEPMEQLQRAGDLLSSAFDVDMRD